MVARCIADLKERDGSSRAAIEKYFEEKRASKAWDLPENFSKTLSLQLKRCAAVLPAVCCTAPLLMLTSLQRNLLCVALRAR